jgi:hypothetical protein
MFSEIYKDLKTSQRLKDFIIGCQSDLQEGYRLLLTEPKLNYDPKHILQGFEISQHSFMEADITIRYVSPSGALIDAEYTKYHAPERLEFDEQTKCRWEEYVGAHFAERKLKDEYKLQLEELKSLTEGKDIIWWPGQKRFGYYYSDDQPTASGNYPLSIEPVMVRARYDRESEIVRLYCPKHPLAELVSSQVVKYPHDRWTFCPVGPSWDFRICSNPADWRPE